MERKQKALLPAVRFSVRLTCAAAALVLLFCVLLPLQGEAGVREEVLRFHVVANSDSGRDQELKREVRDLLLSLTREGLEACSDRAAAEVFLQLQSQKLMGSVCAFLKQEGADYGARAYLVREWHEAKTYGDITLPAGEYLSYRVLLGEGRGKNFFCVLFPPLCVPPEGTRESEVLVRYGTDAALVRLITPAEGRETRFFALDLFRRIFQM